MQLNNMPDTIQKTLPEDEISLKDILAEIKLWIKLVRTNFLFLLFLGLLGGSMGFAYAYFTKPIYSAKLSFVIKRNDVGSVSGSLSGLSSLLGMGTNTAGSSIDRVIQLAGSQSIVGKALLKNGLVGGKQDLLINHYIRLAELKDSWEEDTVLNQLTAFPLNSQYETLDYPHRKAIKQVIALIVGSEENSIEGILTRDYDEKSAIINLTVEYVNEDFSIACTRAVYNELVQFYTLEALASTSSNVNVLKNKVDSIKSELYATQRASAQKSDQALGLILQEDRVDQKSLNVKENLLTLMYGEAQKNLEALSFMEFTSKPIFTIIDEPITPIKPFEKNIILFTLLGSVVVAFLSLIFVRIRLYLSSNLIL
jgi:hypothetical protein